MTWGLFQSMIPGVGQFVSLLYVTHADGLCKNDQKDRRHVWGGNYWGPKNIVFDDGPHPSMKRGGGSMRPLPNHFGHLLLFNVYIIRLHWMYEMQYFLSLSPSVTPPPLILGTAEDRNSKLYVHVEGWGPSQNYAKANQRRSGSRDLLLIFGTPLYLRNGWS